MNAPTTEPLIHSASTTQQHHYLAPDALTPRSTVVTPTAVHSALTPASASTTLASAHIPSALTPGTPSQGADAPNPVTDPSLVKATILFFDIRSSTAIAASTPPEHFAAFLSELLSDIMDLVVGAKGSVNKLLGDGLIATFGCPVSHGTDAWNAVDVATKIQEYLATFNDVRPDWLHQEVRAGIGIATGTVFAGVIGSVRRQEYAVLGDAVNVAARLQSLTKRDDHPILIDHATYQEVRDTIPCAPAYRGRLRGHDHPMAIYKVNPATS